MLVIIILSLPFFRFLAERVPRITPANVLISVDPKTIIMVQGRWSIITSLTGICNICSCPDLLLSSSLYIQKTVRVTACQAVVFHVIMSRSSVITTISSPVTSAEVVEKGSPGIIRGRKN
jgi:hypothetical protein